MDLLVSVLFNDKAPFERCFFICGKIFAVPFYFTIVKPLTRYIFALMGFVLLLLYS